MLQVAAHPLLEVGAFVAELPRALGDSPSPAWLVELLRLDAPAPLSRSETTRQAVRDLLRHGGFKPTGRSKPASEYLAKAAEEPGLASINLLVDACNAASLHSGLPISVVDLDLVSPPLSIRVADPGAAYVFNASGQVIDVGGLVSLHDAAGPCAGPVKDSQRTKTRDTTRRALALAWGTRAAPGLAARTTDWYRELLGRCDGVTRDAALAPLAPA